MGLGEGAQKRLNQWDLIWVILRSLFIQLMWDFERMQNAGFCYAIAPVIGKLYTDIRDRREAICRHLEHFNTHPYMASYILGIVIALEEEKSAGGGIEGAFISSIKTSIMGALASIGDSFFWASLKPVCAILGVSLVLLSGGSWRVAIWGPISYLFLYNTPHILVRIRGVLDGYRLGLGVIDEIRVFNYQRIVRKLRIFGTVVLGSASAVLGGIAATPAMPLRYIVPIGLVCAVVSFAWALKRGVSVTKLSLTIVAGAVAISIVAYHCGVDLGAYIRSWWVF
ncbi:MAG: PTS system mannose/fructose/sorbose family transporter subunit IID [bacterium]